MPPSITAKIYDEVVASRADICVLDEKVDNLTNMVREHEEVLYKHNGKEGLIARINELEDRASSRRKDRKDSIRLQKGFLYGLFGAVILLVVDLVLHYYQ
jgi:hypothetical protein